MINSAFTLDESTIKHMVEQAVQENILSVINSLTQDSVWLDKIERLINQAVVQKTVSQIASMDIRTVIHERIDQTFKDVHENFMQNFSSRGIQDQATQLQLTVMDEATVVENQLVTQDLKVVGTTVVGDLSVLGSINTDNASWNNLAKEISRRTLDSVDQDWQARLVDQVAQQITTQGIEFDRVMVGDQPLVSDNTLASKITQSNLQSVGHLSDLQVKGEAHVYDTLSVVNHRVGINTSTPESALSVWDEEVAVIIGKHKSKQAYIGTSRDQSLVLGVNRQPQVEIDSTGLTCVKKLQVGLHKISHDTQVPGWSGTRGDLVFNASPGPDRVFGWVCLGGHKWQSLKSA